MKPDKIKIEDLEVFANHGVFPEENVLGQKFVVSAVMYTDTRRAGLTDELTASIHYGEASAFITEYLKRENPRGFPQLTICFFSTRRSCRIISQGEW